jgi:hypothetical protein
VNQYKALARNAKKLSKDLIKINEMISKYPKSKSTLKDLQAYRAQLTTAAERLHAAYAALTPSRDTLGDIIERKVKADLIVLSRVKNAINQIRMRNKFGPESGVDPVPWQTRLNLVRQLAAVYGFPIKVTYDDTQVYIQGLMCIDTTKKLTGFNPARLIDECLDEPVMGDDEYVRRYWIIYKGKR